MKHDWWQTAMYSIGRKPTGTYKPIYLATWSDDNITLFHGREQFLGGFEVDIMEWRVSDDALDVRLSGLLLFLFFFFALFCKTLCQKTDVVFILRKFIALT